MMRLSLKLSEENKEIAAGKLGNNGGSNPDGERYGFTNFYMTRNGKPFVPVVGEFHFSRFSPLYWEEELLKMKAGGVSVVATYVFWNHHEEDEGVFEWGGSRNLRHFIDLCAKLDFPLILRIGPFCHGEVRNGGIPDWVFHKQLEIRSNHPEYLKLAERLYREIGKQAEGTLFQDGGPVIGVQLENEFMHCGAPLDSWGYKSGVFMSSGSEGAAHLKALRSLAEQSGLKPLFFTATAWGGAAVPEEDTLPMLAGYAYTPWIPNQPPSGEYLFRDLHEVPMEDVHYDTRDYPVAYCEMAGGMQVSYTARPLVSPDSVEAMTLVKLASGSNLLGYYMYHGGSNPVGKHSFLNETGLPKITYDYQSPLGEFGRVGESYDRIRALALMLDSFGESIAPMGTQLPEGQSSIKPENTDAARWCVRHRNGSGFLFLNNFQDHVETKDHRDVRVELDTGSRIAAFPKEGTMTLRAGQGAMLPFGLEWMGIVVLSATVQPLVKLDCSANGESPLLIFQEMEGVPAELFMDKNAISEIGQIEVTGGGVTEHEDGYRIHTAAGRDQLIRIVKNDQSVLSIVVFKRQEALQTYKLKVWGQERIVWSEGRIHERNGRLICTSEGSESWQVGIYPPPAFPVSAAVGSAGERREGLFALYELEAPAYAPAVQTDLRGERHAVLGIEAKWPETVGDVFLSIDYEGDVASAALNGKLITDHIQYGDSWRIGLKQFRGELERHPLALSITPLRQGNVFTFVNQALVERFEGREIAQFNAISAVPHYVIPLVRKNG